MDNLAKLKLIIESILMASHEPISIDSILTVFDEWEKPTRSQIIEVLIELTNDYKERSIELVLVASGYCFQTKQDYAKRVARLFSEKPVKYSQALYETLSIIAYKQPVTRADIENIRGVAVSTYILKTLIEREWVRQAGFRDVPGKPALYKTTNVFLDYFNLASLDDLPLLDTLNHE